MMIGFANCSPFLHARIFQLAAYRLHHQWFKYRNVEHMDGVNYPGNYATGDQSPHLSNPPENLGGASLEYWIKLTTLAATPLQP
jgi:hypothetical protein